MVKRVRFPASQSAALARCPLQASDPASEHVWKDGFMEELLLAVAKGGKRAASPLSAARGAVRDILKGTRGSQGEELVRQHKKWLNSCVRRLVLQGPTVVTCEILSGDAVTGTQDPATFTRCHKPSYPRATKASPTMTPAHGPEDVKLPLSQQDGQSSHFEGEKGSLFYPCQRWQPQLQNGWVS